MRRGFGKVDSVLTCPRGPAMERHPDLELAACPGHDPFIHRVVWLSKVNYG